MRGFSFLVTTTFQSFSVYRVWLELACDFSLPSHKTQLCIAWSIWLQRMKAPQTLRDTRQEEKKKQKGKENTHKKKTQSCPKYIPGASGEKVRVNIIETQRWGNIWISNEPQTVEKAGIQSPWQECTLTVKRRAHDTGLTNSRYAALNEKQCFGDGGKWDNWSKLGKSDPKHLAAAAARLNVSGVNTACQIERRGTRKPERVNTAMWNLLQVHFGGEAAQLFGRAAQLARRFKFSPFAAQFRSFRTKTEIVPGAQR